MPHMQLSYIAENEISSEVRYLENKWEIILSSPGFVLNQRIQDEAEKTR